MSHDNYYSQLFLPFFWIDTVIDSFHLLGSFFLFQTELMSLWIPDSNVSPPAWIGSARIWSLQGSLYFFNFAVAISSSRILYQVLMVQLYVFLST
jgi:hypothetical protein